VPPLLAAMSSRVRIELFDDIGRDILLDELSNLASQRFLFRCVCEIHEISLS
jgi:hypothetical protein